MKYSQSDIDKVEKSADIRDFIPGADSSKAQQYLPCPNCHKEGKGKGLLVTHKGDKNMAHCFSCDFTLVGGINAYRYYKHADFLEALETVANQCGVILHQEEDQTKRTSKPRTRAMKVIQPQKSFCEKQLEASGLTFDDVTAEVFLKGSKEKTEVPTFRKGGVNAYGDTNETEDEMLIFYYDLWGNPIQYATKGAAGRLRPYVRTRWSNPDIHLDLSGRPIKYQTPKGAPTELYIPQYIRSAFNKEQHIDTLIVQEGEKKAEKACKHGIPSVGIQGIYNIGNQETGLIQSLQYLVQKCTIKNVVLLMDSDWQNLHRNIQDRDNVDQRPHQFFKAVVKFKKYLESLRNINLSVDIFFGHINENEKGDKGIDDLLVNTLKGKERMLRDDMIHAMNSHDGKGEFVDIHKISSLTDYQIGHFWLLDDHDAFFELHKNQLLELKQFRFGKIGYTVDDGKFIQSSKYSSGKDFWLIGQNDKGKKTVDFDIIEALNFISANGFYRMHTYDLEVDQYKFVHVEDGVVSPSGCTEIRDFVYYYALQTCKDRDVLMMLASRLGTLLGPDKLERVTKIDDSFDRFDPDIQRMYYLNGQIEITARGIEFGNILGQVWEDKVIKRKFKRVPIFEDITYSRGKGFDITLTAEGEKCEFLKFLQNVSNFWFKPGYQATEDDLQEYKQHIVNKITSIGFLLTDYKYQTELKAVIAMDGQMGDVAQSNGRTGKSLIGVAIGHVLAQTTIDGKTLKNDDDFLYSSVTLRTRNIFIDDVRVNFDFERFFSAVTADLSVNPKTKARFVIPKEKSPKFYITTNHALNTYSRSAAERITYMAFSDWYNDTHHPIDDFGHQFFADWDAEQWNLFDNFMAECCMFYFKSLAEQWFRMGQGAVQPPMRDIRLRTLKQQMGEAFYQWAEAFFESSEGSIPNRGRRLVRKDLLDTFHSQFPERTTGVSASNFKTKIILYCQFKGWHFNPTKKNKEGYLFTEWHEMHPEESFEGTPDKSGGVEYFTLSTTEEILKNPL